MGLNAWKAYKDQVDGLKIEDLDDGGEMWEMLCKYFREFVEHRGALWSDYAEHMKTVHPRSQAIPVEHLQQIAKLIYPSGGVKLLAGFEKPTVFVCSNNADANFGFIVRSVDLVRSYYLLSQILINTKYQRDLGMIQ